MKDTDKKENRINRIRPESMIDKWKKDISNNKNYTSKKFKSPDSNQGNHHKHMGIKELLHLRTQIIGIINTEFNGKPSKKQE